MTNYGKQQKYNYLRRAGYSKELAMRLCYG